MNSKQKITLGLLTLGLVFSSIIRVKFNISNGFEFQELWITLPLPLFDFASKSSNEMALTTTFLGYLIYAVFGLLLITDVKALINKDILLAVFLFVTIIALAFELISVIQGLNSNLERHHARVGPTLFLIGLWILVKKYRLVK